MARKRHIFRRMIIICLLIGLSASPLKAVSAQGPQRAMTHQDIPESYELIAENALFQLYVNKSTLGFKVLDKRSGYIWSATLDEKAQGDRLNKSWTAFAQSGISIEYLDPKAVNKRVSITNSTTAIDVSPIDQGITVMLTFTEYGISLGVTIKLEENGVSLEIPFDSIRQENADYKLGLLYVYPFMGATRGDSVPGYMFIPDGSGSLIRFAAETKAKNMFYGRYYGADLGMITEIPYDWTTNRPSNISIPVIGMVHEEKQSAFIAIVENGAAYGEIQAHPSGLITNFNFIYNAFVYNESYFQATNRSGAGVTTIQRDTNAFDVKIHYRFLNGADADYVGLAKSYQRYLIDKGVLKKISDSNQDIGLKLEFLAGDKEKVLFWQRLIPMTTVSQMETILSDLDIRNTEVVYYGWQPIGAASMPPRSLKLAGGLGRVSQLRALAEKISLEGGRFYLYLDPQAALWREPGYSPRNDLAMSITKANAVGYNRDKVNYFFNLEALTNRYSSLRDDVFSKPYIGLALDEIGSTLYSDFKPHHFLNREDAIEQYQNLMSKNNGPVSFYMPNDYMFAYMQAYYDMPLSDNGYIYTTESVPFLEIVLAGYVPFYGRALNFSSNLQEDKLRQVDYGIYPSYFLTQEVTAKILNTSSSWIYTSSYAQWGTEIKQTYQWMNNLLAPIKDQEIIARVQLAAGVEATTYANGKQIIVNYTDQPFTIGGLTVNARDAAIREVRP